MILRCPDCGSHFNGGEYTPRCPECGHGYLEIPEIDNDFLREHIMDETKARRVVTQQTVDEWPDEPGGDST